MREKKSNKEDEMEIKDIVSQFRRDFIALYVCEHCGAEKKGDGYDDTYFHQGVIPVMKCEKCGKIASENYKPRQTKYPDSQRV